MITAVDDFNGGCVVLAQPSDGVDVVPINGVGRARSDDVSPSQRAHSGRIMVDTLGGNP